MAYNDYSPPAIINAGKRVAALYVGDPGSVTWSKGDANHTDGYHRGAAYIPVGDYSHYYAADMQGDPYACSALDLGIGVSGTIAVTIALRQLWQAGRLPAVVAEIGGTLDGRNTYNLDVAGGLEGYNQWDDSHLSHPHISGWRAYATDDAAWDDWATAVIQQLTGAAPADLDEPGGPDMIVGQDQGTGRIWLISGNSKLEFPVGGGVASGDGLSAGNTGNIYVDELLAMIANAYPGSDPKFVPLNPDIVGRIPDVWAFMPDNGAYDAQADAYHGTKLPGWPRRGDHEAG